MKVILTAALLVLTLVVSLGCSDDSGTVNPADKLCRGDNGVGARIVGMSEPVEFCVSNDATSTTYPSSDPDRYDIRATWVKDDLTIEISISFVTHATLPGTFAATGNRALALSDPNSVWFFYTEAKGSDYLYTSADVTGPVTITFSDETVGVGTFAGLKIFLEDAAQNDVGTREIEEGFFSVTPD